MKPVVRQRRSAADDVIIKVLAGFASEDDDAVVTSSHLARHLFDQAVWNASCLEDGSTHLDGLGVLTDDVGVDDVNHRLLAAVEQERAGRAGVVHELDSGDRPEVATVDLALRLLEVADQAGRHAGLETGDETELHAIACDHIPTRDRMDLSPHLANIRLVDRRASVDHDIDQGYS